MIPVWAGIFFLIAAFFLMELAAWLTHKFAMHGFMWYFHRDHHQGKSGFFERNDVFFLIFAIPSWLGIMLGLMYQQYAFVWMGFGIMAYGFAYFLVHDVFIHRRFKWIREINMPYFMAIRRAHKVHHKHIGKEDGECFGLLIVPVKYYLEARRSVKQNQDAQ
ncbi:sterol desaturase family protein [Fluviicola sp.]|jgi:beta-carotene 3-hydroxylase|uniref:sterol desaturase family protein n=1 Tax=Fluviicola sp. TaxID=1917219 RepID=UPI002818EC5C|nr:sterol desaturase family protein [Fluviicola sp.]MDR0803179.1 sterol desaturase family protein [Fluviicola sp.]